MYSNITAPRSAPKNIRYLTDQATTTSLTFSFEVVPCGSRGGNISYDPKVTILDNDNEGRELEDNINAIFSFTFNNGTGTVTISGLQSETPYLFRVRGINGNGTHGTLPGPYGIFTSGWTSAVIGKTQSLLFMNLQ